MLAAQWAATTCNGQRCLDDPDMQFAMIDCTIVKVHRHGQSAKGVVKPSQKIALQHASRVRFP
jgi:hypothetical protein